MPSLVKRSSYRTFVRLARVSVLYALVLVLLSPAAGMADHECVWDAGRCLTYTHGHNRGTYDRDINVWTPSRYDIAGSYNWYKGHAVNTRTYHFIYATGGRILDSYAIWEITEGHDSSPPRGLYELWVRIPETDSGATVPATATAYYNVYFSEGGVDRLVTSFVIDQRRQQGWVSSGRVLLLKSPDSVKITLSDEAAWPDVEQVGSAASVVAADAVHLQHEGFLKEDISYAQLQCAARLPDGKHEDVNIDEVARQSSGGWSVYGSSATSIGSTILGLIPAIPNPVSAGISIGLALADPISRWIHGETIFGAADKLVDARRRLDVTAFLGAARFGGKWERSPERFLIWERGRRYYNYSDPGPCELLSTWERYLPPGA